MRLSKIHIENFRNLKNLDLELSKQIVILGKNKTGESNLIYALRLLLAPTLTDSARQLSKDDLGDSLSGHFENQEKIIISAEFINFEDNDNELTILSSAIISGKPSILNQVAPAQIAEYLKVNCWQFFLNT